MLVAVSSSPRPWIDIFALPEKFNMAVTESDLDPKVHSFLMAVRATSELSMRAWNQNVTESKKTILDLIIQRYIRYNSPKKYPTILYAVNLWLKPVSCWVFSR